ncbi:MAG: cyclic nucleotide-binding domain-containing protein [Magnetococcales bacterium]|nr:cyclic nucleotide-binding domain-containing protein [Magnetococcales bacterium]
MTNVEDEISIENLINFLAKIPGLKDLSHSEMESLIAPIISITNYEPGQNIIRFGADGNTVLFIYKGQARVDIPMDAGENIQFVINSGEILGEMALVTREKRSADVFAVTGVMCLTIDIETFQTLMLNNWRVTKAVAGLIGERRIKRLTSIKN